MTRCVQDIVALGSENCNAALVCLSSGSWIASSLRKIDFAAIFVLNLIQKNSQSTYASLWYHVKTEHAIERPVWSDASQIPPAKRTKLQSSFFSYSTDGRKSKSMVDCLFFKQISTSSFIRNSMQQKYKVAHMSHTTIHAKVKEFWEVAKEDTVVDLKKL